MLRIMRRGTRPVVTWRRAEVMLLFAQSMGVAGIAKVAFTSEGHVRDVIGNFNADGFDSLYPCYRGEYPPKFTLRQRREIKKIAQVKAGRSWPALLDPDPAEAGGAPGRRGGSGRHQPRGPGYLAPRGGVMFQRLKTWKGSTDPEFVH